MDLPLILRNLVSLADYIYEDLPPGPKIIPMNWVVNLQKGGTAFFVLTLMTYFNNFSPSCWYYLSLHGTYGLIWLLKDQFFQDTSLQNKKMTIPSALLAWVLILGPYWTGAVLVTTQVSPQTVDALQLSLAISLCTVGCCVMMMADLQKWIFLKEKKNGTHHMTTLMSDIWYGTRNPNFLGEMMIYGSFTVVIDHWLFYVIILYSWCSIIAMRMLAKELSLQKKKEWSQYRNQSWLLLPRPSWRNSPSVMLFTYVIGVLGVFLFLQSR
mmetsp:Transcript_17857/g.20261  ORF Transcript_17857/g.20261 Transcript_17857/m.20261 type:complete len:268 (+) Transcript_17857:35-838(+)